MKISEVKLSSTLLPQILKLTNSLIMIESVIMRNEEFDKRLH